jgi:hypothetical protein
MDHNTPKGNMPPSIKGTVEKCPWALPVLKRLDVALTSAKNDGNKPLDGATTGHQHS